MRLESVKNNFCSLKIFAFSLMNEAQLKLKCLKNPLSYSKYVKLEICIQIR